MSNHKHKFITPVKWTYIYTDATETYHTGDNARVIGLMADELICECGEFKKLYWKKVDQ